ncbi:MAG: 2-amino-3,7-dideoxy-D-threo-hept-6-ulosonate synthase [Syntrophobacteraceae bacterium]
MNGRELRLKRFIAPYDGRTVVFPLDHGVTCGPVHGLEYLENAVLAGVRGGADGLVLHKGMLACLRSVRERLPGIFMHLSASTLLGTSGTHKVLVGTVEEALRRGADGVSVHVNLGTPSEPEMLRDLGVVGSACAEWQMPLLVMIYVSDAPASPPVPDCALAHAARVAAELGADIIKLSPPQDDRVLAEITRGLPVPVVVAGGSRVPDTRAFLERVERALAAGARGVAVGRNVFQNENPEALMRAVSKIVHRGCTSEAAWNELQEARPV